MTVKGRKKFVPPTEQEVAEYMVTQHDVIPRVAVTQAQQFIGYYESMDWHVGKRKMISWKGAVGGWVSRLHGSNLTHAGKMKRVGKEGQLKDLKRGNAKV